MDLDRILQEKFTSPYCKTYINVNGFTLPVTYNRHKERIENFKIHDEDVWVCSFPKTGTTWTQEMVWMIMNNLDFEKGKEEIDVRSPFFEFSVVADMDEFLKNNPDASPPLHRTDSFTYTENLSSPVLIKTHLPFELLPKEIRNGVKKPKIVYVVREAKDTCVSYYHHTRLFENYTGGFDEFCELFLAGKLKYGPFWKHVFQFWELRECLNVIFLRYEDMKRDLPGVIKKVAQFLERSLTDEQVERLSKHLSFDRMKDNLAVNREKRFSTRKTQASDGKFMRSGIIGDHRNAMSEECTKRFDEWVQKNVQGTDYII